MTVEIVFEDCCRCLETTMQVVNERKPEQTMLRCTICGAVNFINEKITAEGGNK